MCITSLDNTETTHRAARWIVGSNCIAIDCGVLTAIRALNVGYSIDQYGRRSRRISTAIEDHLCFNALDYSGTCRMMLDINLGWVSMNVTIETFFTAVLHLDRTRGS